MNTLAITSITNFVLASEIFFLAGLMVKTPKARFSAAWFWGGALFCVGLSALIGGIDHGFFEQAQLPRYFIQRLTWLVIGLATFCTLLTTARQFFSPRVQRIMFIVGVIQFVGYASVVLLLDSYLPVVLNYALVILLLLVMSCIGLKQGTGSWLMVVGILLLLIASAIQLLSVDIFSPLDHNGLYHAVSMLGILFLYRGGQRLRMN